MNTNYHYIITTFTSQENMSDIDIECTLKNCKSIATSSWKMSSKGTDRRKCEPCKRKQKVVVVFLCARKQNSSLELSRNTADCNCFPISKQCPLHYSTEYRTHVLQHILTNYRFNFKKSLFFLATQSKISRCTFMIFTVLESFREPLGL